MSATAAGARAARAAATRERILGAARQVLAAEGLERFTTRRVADLAGISHGMVHYHFRDKRDLILALVVHARRDWIEPLEELVDGPGTAEDRMRAVIAWMAEPATTDVLRVHFALYSYALTDDVVRRRMAAEYQRWRAPFVKLFGELREERGLDGFDAQSLGEAFATAADGLVQQQSFDPALPTERMLTRLFERLVGSPPAGRQRGSARKRR
ncbi:MAG TPA: TetR/AcrR family transcriptional regulator [Actinomycetota bacterium]|nr:TetR/AcrR family transcriptional regulator [Actinomycetota bacterium]